MPETGYLLAAVGVAAAVTWTLRALPFVVLAPLRRSPLVPYLGARLPVGVMVVLVGYSLRHTAFTVPPYGAAAGIALAATVALHLWRRNVVLSIVGGTTVHVVLTTLWG